MMPSAFSLPADARARIDMLSQIQKTTAVVENSKTRRVVDGAKSSSGAKRNVAPLLGKLSFGSAATQTV